MVGLRILIRVIDCLGLRFYIQRFMFNVQRIRFNFVHRRIDLSGFSHIDSHMKSSLDFLIIAPWTDMQRQPWEIAGGNYFFEILQSAREIFNEKQIGFQRIGLGQSGWEIQIINQVITDNPRNLLLQIETDPDGSGNWNIDSLARNLKRIGWKGRLFLLSYDSVFPLHMFRIDRVARIYQNSVVISIDRSCEEYYRSAAPNIGPAFLPISQASLQAINQHFASEAGLGLGSDLTFIGAEYGYRLIALDALHKAGLPISINPHNKGIRIASYLEYASAIHDSLATLNFSRAHVIDSPQVKSRIIEAMLFNCVVITDDSHVLEKFFDINLHFLSYSSPQELVKIYQDLVTDKDRQEQFKQRALTRALEVNKWSFWGQIERFMD